MPTDTYNVRSLGQTDAFDTKEDISVASGNLRPSPIRPFLKDGLAR